MMKKQVKSLRRIGAWALAAAMILGIALPAAPVTVEAVETTVTGVNYAPGGTATASNVESGTQFTADKAIDGDSTTSSSRWGTDHDPDAAAERWLKVDLGAERTFNRFVIVWERTNITGFVIETSNTNNDSDWTAVYTKTGSADIESATSEIKLTDITSARYVRLRVTGYNGGTINWPSVSVYEFKIIADVDVVGEDVLKNLSLDATASADSQEANTVAVEYANDGNQGTHWGSGVGEASEQNPHWLQLTWDAPQTIQTIKIHWERPNTTAYSLQISSDGSSWQDIMSFDTAPDDYWQTIELDAPITTQYLKINITAFNPTGAPEGGSSVTWATVGVCEFETYSYAGILETEEEQTLQDVVDGLAAPEVNQEGTAVTLPTVDGCTVELLADYEQIVDRDGTIYKPLTQKNVKAIYKVTQGEGENAESVEGTREYTLTIPGLHDDTGMNPKPTVIPELSEWYGGDAEGNFNITDDTTIYVSDSASSFTAAAQALADDYNVEMGTNLTVRSGDSAGAGDILFTVDAESGLDEEGYIMEIGDSLTVKAEENTGAYWATRSIIQIGKLNNGSIPKGITKDYPKYEVRSFSLDVARKPASMSMLEDVVKAMSYYKMNDFQVHLNDNLIFYENAFFNGAEDARERAYTGFRLESSIVEDASKNQVADLTNKDLYYTKKEFRDFIETAERMGINIVPEIDTPGHSGAFTKVRPDLMLPEAAAVNGTRARAGEQFDLSGDVNSPDSQYGKSLEFVKSVWNEYLNEDLFDSSMTVHIGTDEYYGEANAFRHFSDDMIEFIQDSGRTVRMWGSLTQLAGDGTVDVRSENVQLNVWNTGYSNPAQMYNDGFDLINTLDGSLYMVPNGSGGRGGYGDYLNTTNLYNNWEPNKFGGTVIPAGSEQMLGSTFAIWNDNIDTSAQGISEVDNFERFEDALPVLASKNWGEGDDLTFDQLKEKAAQLGDAPQSNPYYKADADENDKYMSYEFTEGAEKTDSSHMGRNLSDPAGTAEISGGKLQLNGGESYVTTEIGKLATGSTLSFDIKLDTPPQAGQILFEADHPGGNNDYVHDIRIMDDGRLGFRRELYDYYFDYKLPVGQEVHIEISTDTLSTTLTVNGQEYPATGIYINRQTDNTVRKQNIANATLLLPLQRIGSETNAVSAEIDNVNVTVAQQDVDEFNKAGWTGTASSEYTSNPSSSEGEIEKGFDNDSGTIWHSNYGNNSMKLECVAGGTLKEVSAEINLGQKYTINQFSFTPRVGANSGQVTKADLYVKANEGDGWIQVAEDQIFADDASQKTFHFEAQEVQYIKFVAKESDDGWVAVSEFDVANAPAQTYTVYVDAQEGGRVSGGETGMAANAEVTVTAAADTGYTFAGWYDAVTGTKVSDEAGYTFNVTENTALRAYFTKNTEPEPETHTVTIDGEPQSVKDGEKAVKPATDPIKAGHEFLGWFEENAEAAFNFDQPITGDVTLTARFQAYTVTAVADSGVTVSQMDDQGRVTVTAEAREGYNFTGWLVNGTKVSAGLSYTFVPEANMTVEPVYEQIAPDKTYYNVTINGQTIRVEENTYLTRPADPVREGYTFIGWYVGNQEYNFSTPVTSDLVIEARFQPVNTPAGVGNTGGQSGDKAVSTGDVSDFAPWALVLVSSAGAVIVLTKRKRNY